MKGFLNLLKDHIPKDLKTLHCGSLLKEVPQRSLWRTVKTQILAPPTLSTTVMTTDWWMSLSPTWALSPEPQLFFSYMSTCCVLQGCFANTSDTINSKLNLLAPQTILSCCALSSEPNKNLGPHGFLPSYGPSLSLAEPYIHDVDSWQDLALAVSPFTHVFYFLPRPWPWPRVLETVDFCLVSGNLILPPLTYPSTFLSRKATYCKPNYLLAF